MKICASQFRSSLELDCNVARHVEVVRMAAEEGCDLVLFPELSLTGYRPSAAKALALTEDAQALRPLQEACDQHGVVIAAGAPLRAAAGVEIGLVFFRPGQPVSSYAKQQLHADEVPFFVPGRRIVDVDRAGVRIAPAICFESLLPAHARAARARGASIYAASVAKPEAAIGRAHAHYAGLGLAVVVANAVGEHEGLMAAGRSAAWDAQGRLLAELGETEDMLVVEVEDGRGPGETGPCSRARGG